MGYLESYCKSESEINVCADPTPLDFAEKIKQIISGSEFRKTKTQPEMNMLINIHADALAVLFWKLVSLPGINCGQLCNITMNHCHLDQWSPASDFFLDLWSVLYHRARVFDFAKQLWELIIARAGNLQDQRLIDELVLRLKGRFKVIYQYDGDRNNLQMILEKYFYKDYYDLIDRLIHALIISIAQ